MRVALALTAISTVGLGCVFCPLLPPNRTQQFFEDWDRTPAAPDDMRGWTFFLNPSAESFLAEGGNPDGHIRGSFLATGIPSFGTRAGLANDYVGNADFAFLVVAGIRFDLNIFENTLLATARQISLLLINDGGTPDDTSDDKTAVFVTDQIIPLPGSGWRSVTIAIPSQSETLPPEWKLLSDGSNQDWLTIIQDVDRIEITLGDPELVFLLDDMTVGVDNFFLLFQE